MAINKHRYEALRDLASAIVTLRGADLIVAKLGRSAFLIVCCQVVPHLVLPFHLTVEEQVVLLSFIGDRVTFARRHEPTDSRAITDDSLG